MINPALEAALASFSTLGAAQRKAGDVTPFFDPPLYNLRTLWFLYAAATRGEIGDLVHYRERARRRFRRIGELHDG